MAFFRIMKQTLSIRARFGGFVLDVRTGELHGQGDAVLLPQQVFQVLLISLEREGRWLRAMS